MSDNTISWHIQDMSQDSHKWQLTLKKPFFFFAIQMNKSMTSLEKLNS
jgi:hypothetical protein